MSGRKPTGKPCGPPPKEINLEQVLYWIDHHATAQEIAGSFFISTDTLDRRLKESFGMGFAELYKRCSGNANLSLRRYQWDLAKTNASMAIWLGKQHLGQRDPESEKTSQAMNVIGNLLASLKESKNLIQDDNKKNKDETCDFSDTFSQH